LILRHRQRAKTGKNKHYLLPSAELKVVTFWVDWRRQLPRDVWRTVFTCYCWVQPLRPVIGQCPRTYDVLLIYSVHAIASSECLVLRLPPSVCMPSYRVAQN